MKVDIVNLSVSLDDEHEEVVNEMTEKYGIIVTKAAGNCGPVYSSLYETDVKIKNIFIIGSVYTIKDDFKKDDAIIPVYSSRGPGINGSRGISFVAPGDAITAVPRYSSIKHEILYGTSFSAPNAAGAIACLLSALKDNDIKYSVSSIKTALEKTAFLPKNGDVLGFGHGIIQIYDAFKFLKKFNLAIVQNYSNRKRKLKIISDKSIKNGIFVKLNNENDAIKDGYEIKLLNDTEFGSCSPPKRIKLQSTTKSKNANFVLHSKITKNYSFKIAIQKHKLKFGALNYTEIHGILFSKIPYFQQLFHLPITVISPSNVTKEEGYCIKENQLKLSPNIPYRFFILPPKEICQCIVTVAVETRASLYLQYSIENISVSSTTGKWLEFNETTKVLTFDIKIYGNKIHEIAIFPDIDEPINCDIEIQFYGIEVIKNSLENKKVVDQNVITFKNNLQNLHATLIMEFENISFKLSPIQFNFENNKSQYDICENECLKLTYNFTLPKKSKCLFKMNLEKIFKMFRVQVFTESKKYVYGYVTDLKEPVS
uniref:Peptidase S8/S53 domain-containing protein n=1 Tax=Panagrolaimus sp. PS1159 TaxID=55785 RepID=A0AC35ETA8_9BILA